MIRYFKGPRGLEPNKVQQEKIQDPSHTHAPSVGGTFLYQPWKPPCSACGAKLIPKRVRLKERKEQVNYEAYKRAQ